MRFRQLITIVISATPILLGIGITGVGIWMTAEADKVCMENLQWMVPLMGGLVMAAGLAGLFGTMQHKSWLILLFQVVMLVVIMVLLALVIYTFVVTSKPGWLLHKVANPAYWAPVAKCLASTGLCSHVSHLSSHHPRRFKRHNTTRLQEGCCAPPKECGYKFKYQQGWIDPSNKTAEADCNIWSNNETELCYGCNSCKEALAANLKREWNTANIILVITLVILIVNWYFGILWLIFDFYYLWDHGGRLIH